VTQKLEAVIFDWAGTTVDHGSLAPVRVLIQVFSANGTPVSDQQARRDMGLPKRDHIERILNSPGVAEQWTLRHGRPPSGDDVDRLFAEFTPLQMECLAEYSRLIPGTKELAARLRSRALKIGSTTGYTRPMLDLLLEWARRAERGPFSTLGVTDRMAWATFEPFARLHFPRDDQIRNRSHNLLDRRSSPDDLLSSDVFHRRI